MGRIGNEADNLTAGAGGRRNGMNAPPEPSVWQALMS
jgi:hypothetical protein